MTTHLTDLQCSMYVDHALSADEVELIDHHVADCSACQQQLAVFAEDQSLISAALVVDSPAPQLAMPKFKKPVGLREFALANIATGLVFWFAQFSSKAIFGELVVEGFSWMTSLFVPDLFDLVVTTVLYFTNEGTVMIENYSGLIVGALLAIVATWVLLAVTRYRKALSFCALTAVVGGGVMMPQDANAIEHMRDTVIIASGESVNDTLVFTGESLVVDGDIKGDLFAFGRRIVVTGTVEGNLFAFAESVSISGKVSGTTISAGDSVEMTDAKVNGDFWGGGENIQLSANTSILGNVVVAAELVSIHAAIGKDLIAATETIEVRGSVGEDMVAYAGSVKLLGEASIAGNLTVHSDSEETLSRSPNATIGGSVDFEHRDGKGRSTNRYATIQFYGFQVLKLAAAFIVAYGLFKLFPAIRSISLNGGVAGLATAGIGLVALVSLPIILVLVAATVIGLPLALIGFAIWFLALYLAKIMVAWLIGGMLFEGSDTPGRIALPLLAGLALVVIAINIPVIGGVISFLCTVVGIGMMTQWLIASYSAPSAYEE